MKFLNALDVSDQTLRSAVGFVLAKQTVIQRDLFARSYANEDGYPS